MKKHLPKMGLMALILFLSHCFAFSQQTVKGQVLDNNNDPVIGASVYVVGTTLGTITDVNGMYSIDAPEGSSEIEISYIGFNTQILSIADNMDAVVVMSENINTLDEVVITGLATSIKRSNAANAVASIGAQQLTGITSQSTMDGALYGKLKGAEIRANSGAPGGGMSVKLRGVTSIFGDQQPLYIIDGIYVDNSTISLGTNIVSAAAGGGNTSSNQDDASNRIADIVTEDIESIEVLKGASAAAMYGSRAAGGVVLITTKRGKAGEPRLQFSQSIGYASPTKLLGLRESTTQDPGANDYEAELFDNKGLLSTSHLSYSGGTDKTNFYVSGMIKDEEGLVVNTGYDKKSVRLNLDHKFSNLFEINISSNYVNAQSDRGFFNNGNTNTTVGYALAFTSPYEDLFPDENGNYPAGGAGSNVLETTNLITNREDVSRFFNGARATLNLFTKSNQSLKAVINGGRDEYILQTTSLFPQALSFFSDPASLSGVSIVGNTTNKVNNVSAFLVHTLFADNGTSFRTQAGVTREHFDQNTVINTSTGLNGNQSNLDQSANQSVYHNRKEQLDKGFFVQEEVNLNDRIIATVGVRGDKSSNNGDANKFYFYPKASLALNLHEFDFWSSGAINNFKIRAAYGEAGRFANFNDRFNALTGNFIGGNAGLETTNLRGNGEVGPERQQELELGTDLVIMDKLSVEFTFYNKNIKDVLLQANIPTSTGFTRQVLNGAELNNKGIELSLGLRAIDNSNLKWDTHANFWKNSSEVTKLDVPAFNLGGFAASLGQYRIEEGKSATQIVGTQPDSPDFKVYGDAEADFNLSWINSMYMGDFELSWVLHLKQGGDGVNLSTLLYDLAGNTWDYDDTTLDPSGELGNGDYRTSEWFAGNAGPWIEDASYLRLREVGIYYNIDRSAIGDVADLRIGFSGRNLINVFDYNSYDPEVSNFGGNVLANSIEVTPYPASKRLNFHLTATF